MIRGKPPGKISRRGRIGDTFSAQGIHIGLIITVKLYIIKTRAAGKGIIRNVQKMVRFMIRLMLLQQPKPGVNGLDQSTVTG